MVHLDLDPRHPRAHRTPDRRYGAARDDRVDRRQTVTGRLTGTADASTRSTAGGKSSGSSFSGFLRSRARLEGSPRPHRVDRTPTFPDPFVRPIKTPEVTPPHTPTVPPHENRSLSLSLFRAEFCTLPAETTQYA